MNNELKKKRFVHSLGVSITAASLAMKYGEDVYKAIKSGADATGGTSGIVAAQDPYAKLDEMFEALDKARTDFCK